MILHLNNNKQTNKNKKLNIITEIINAHVWFEINRWRASRVRSWLIGDPWIFNTDKSSIDIPFAWGPRASSAALIDTPVTLDMLVLIHSSFHLEFCHIPYR